MSRKSYRRRIASATAHLSQALLIVLLSASILGAGELVANEYGEIDETPMATDPATQEGATILRAEGEEMAEEVTISGSTVPEDISVLSDEVDPSGEEEAETRASDTSASEEAEEVGEEIEEAEPTMAEAVVYVFNNDDDTLSISLFIDSELLGTEDVSKEKEKKFGNYELLAGSHNFKISWWDDDTKKTHQEELVATVEGETAVTLYATQNKEPEEFEVNVMLQNENPEDLEAYLYIDGEYEKQKTAKKESITDFGKFDIEEGTHEVAVRWEDPETKIEYEKRKTIRVDGKDVVTFYAPAGMTFESDEEAASGAATSKTTTSSKTTATTKTASTSTTKNDEGEEGGLPSTTGTSGSSQPSGEVKSAADKGQREPEPDDSKGSEGSAGPDVEGATLILSTIGAILAIYIIFFRR